MRDDQPLRFSLLTGSRAAVRLLRPAISFSDLRVGFALAELGGSFAATGFQQHGDGFSE
jgi:hypothetical protein